MAPQEEEQIATLVEEKPRYTVIRGSAYDITEFRHPGGAHMIDLAVDRDCTVMFESYHLRLELAEKFLNTLKKYPVEELEAKGYDFGRKETVPTPSQSVLYETIRKRVVEEVLKPRGMATGPVGARGVPMWHYAAVIITWMVAVTTFVLFPSVPSGLFLGFSLVWVGTGVQHTANHGALSKSTMLEYLIGLLDDIAPGGSSLVWRYHHNVGHHAYCNDIELDPDAYSSFPLIRLDSSQEWHPYHRFQFIYASILFCFMWFAIQHQDFSILLAKNPEFFGIHMKGTPRSEINTAIALKFVHYFWFLALPLYLHGFQVMIYPWIAALGFGGWALAAMFIVSHNVDHVKVENSLENCGDWASMQIGTSTSWGGAVGSFFSGGLNLQIEHHLFPGIAHNLNTFVAPIVKEECEKVGIKYCAYPTLFHNFVDHIKFLYQMGKPETAPCKTLENGKKAPLLVKGTIYN